MHRTRVLAMRSLLSDEVDRHRKDFEPTNKRDFIDAFIAEIKNSGEDDESAFHESEGYEQLVQTLIDLVRERVLMLKCGLVCVLTVPCSSSRALNPPAPFCRSHSCT